jgi:hypothetical protein
MRGDEPRGIDDSYPIHGPMDMCEIHRRKGFNESINLCQKAIAEAKKGSHAE